MIDKDKIISDQQKKIERIEKLQDELHKISMFGALMLKVLPSFGGDSDSIGLVLSNMHKLSHVIKDVLEGADPVTTLKDTLTNDVFGGGQHARK